MSYYNFRLLSPAGQLRYTLTHGTYLLQRDTERSGVNLYYCADEGRGYFVEIGVDEADERYVVLRSFVASRPLEDYSHYVRLPELQGTLRA